MSASPVDRDTFRRGFILLGITLSLAACGKPETAQKATTVPVRVVDVKLQAADRVERYAAQVRPRIEADLGFRVGGKVIARLVEIGDRVTTGTPLAKLDPADLDLQVRSAEAQLASARADAVNARNDFERYAQLRRGEWATQQEYDRRNAAMLTAQAKVREYEAQLNVVRNSAAYSTLTADGPGVISAVSVEPGQVVASGQTVFKLARSGEMEIAASVPEQYVGILDKAQLSADFWSLPGVSVSGKLREITPIAETTTRTYQVRITLIDPPPQVQLGMSATLVARWERDGQVALLPSTALTKEGTDPAVWVLIKNGEGLEKRLVSVGGLSGGQILVLAGLNDGDRVVTAGAHKLDAGMKVRVWTEPVR